MATDQPISLGDIVTLFCPDSSGYVVSAKTGSCFNGLYVYTGQEDKDHPIDVPDQHAITFQICAKNRYKFTKKYRKYSDLCKKQPDNEEYQREVAENRAAAEAEQAENDAEQLRQHGRHLRYGQIIQLRHLFTHRYMHVSTTQTSHRDKNSMMVTLVEHNAKHAQFWIRPRFKVKSDGDIVQAGDQVCFESTKSPSHFLHSSNPWQIDSFMSGCELNLGVQLTGSTIGKFQHPTAEDKHFVKGGSALRLFHRETESYMMAEGLFHDRITEDVHLRVRPMDQARPHSMRPSTSGATYWQVEPESSFVNGDVITWGQNIRLRHMTTRLYLYLDENENMGLTDKIDANTVFRLHAVIQERNQVEFESYCRIEHVITRRWVHAKKGHIYERKEAGDDSNLHTLRWDQATLLQVESKAECQYDDAYTLQEVSKDDLTNFHWAAGIVPVILNLIKQTESGPANINRTLVTQSIISLRDLDQFQFVNGEENKNRQKLLRNLRIVDLLVRYLKTPIPRDGELRDMLLELHIQAYSVLETYLLGDSRKNELYFAKHIPHFQEQFSVPGKLGLRATSMVTEMVRDNRKVVDRHTYEDIDYVVDLVRKTKNYRFLELLSVLCVCDGVAIPEHQTYITKKWLEESTAGVFLTELGDEIGMNRGRMYVSKDGGQNWIAFHKFCDKEATRRNSTTTDEEYKFLESQLNLFGNLSFQRNEHAIEVITQVRRYLTWEEAFTCLKEERLPDDLRARYCTLITVLFVDVPGNRPMLDQMNLCYVYAELGKDATFGIDTANLPEKTTAIFVHLRDWLNQFLGKNQDMTGADIGHNKLIEKVLFLLYHLVAFGYYNDKSDVESLLAPLLSLLDGRNDKPKVVPASTLESREYKTELKDYRDFKRFRESPETLAIVDAKCSAIEVVDLLLNLQFNNRLEKFVYSFKKLASVTEGTSTKGRRQVGRRKSGKDKADRLMGEISFFDREQITAILLDLCKYEYDKIVVKSMDLIKRFYTNYEDLFAKTVDAQVLTTEESVETHRKILQSMPILKQLSKAKMNPDECQKVCEIMKQFSEFCQLPNEPDERHKINQSILVNHGVLDVLFELLSQKIDVDLIAARKSHYGGLQAVMRHTLSFLASVTKGNERVQQLLFNRLDTLLLIEGVEKELAEAITEIFTGNQNTCLTIRPHQIKKIVELAAKHQDKAPEFLDLLCAIVKVEELNLPLKRNQGYVITNVLENYHRLVYMLESSQENRDAILRGHQGLDPQSYLVSLIDLISTCTEGENQFIESLAQRATPVEELIRVLNDASIENNLKRPYLRYLLWSYVNTAKSMLETGIVDLAIRIAPWLDALSNEIVNMRNWATNNATKCSLLLKKPIPKSNVGTSEEDQAYGTLHFLFDAAFPFIEVFFRKGFAFEGEEMTRIIDELAMAIQAFDHVVQPLLCDKHQLRALVNAQMSILTVTSMEISQEAYRKLVAVAQAGETKCILSPAQEVDTTYHRGDVVVTPGLMTPSQQKVVDKWKKKIKLMTSYWYRPTPRWYLKTYGDGVQQKSFFPYEYMDSLEKLQDAALPPYEAFFSTLKNSNTLEEGKRFFDYYKEELHLNRELNRYSIDTHEEYMGVNTVQGQLGFASEREYSEVGEDEDLPLGPEFQEHVRVFIDETNQVNKYHHAESLVKQLTISAKRMPVQQYSEPRQVDLDIRSLQLLRALLHNEERKMPEDWSNCTNRTDPQRVSLKTVQNSLNKFDIVLATLPLITRPQDEVVREYLGLVAAMLLDANGGTQKAMSSYFLGCREELFFSAIQRRLELSKISFKERRFLAAQFKARQEQTEAQVATLVATMGRKLNLGMEVELEGKRMMKEELNQGLMGNGAVSKKVKFENNKMNKKKKKKTEKFHRHVHQEEADENKDNTLIEQRDEGNIELVLRVLAGMCDGQYDILQNYLREQPDNIQSVNLVGEVASYLSLHYTHIQCSNIPLVTQIFDTLNEVSVGNPRNHIVIYDNNVIDYINYIIRLSGFLDCSEKQVLDLKDIIGKLLLSIVEENHEGRVSILKEIREILDFDNIVRTAVNFYEEYSRRSNDDPLKGDFLDSGFLYFFILQRLNDITENDIVLEMTTSKRIKDALSFYRENTRKVEILKDDLLHVIRFRVNDQKILRDEVKDLLKWKIDRTSPSNKVRDLMDWSVDIIEDIYYQREVRNNPVTSFFVRFWPIWNRACLTLSLAINILMLVTWDAPPGGSIALGKAAADYPHLYNKSDINTHAPALPSWYFYAFYPMAAFHNLFSLVVIISYFLSTRPSLPDGAYVKERIKAFFTRQKMLTQKKTSRLRKDLFGFLTFYYMAFVLFSALGTAFYGYFFAFHLLNIIYNNVWLKRVTQAVTLNGRSLLWMGVLGIIVFYIFSLLAFAAFRANFEPNALPPLWCNTLYECTVSMIRYGLIGELFEFMQPNLDHSFSQFAVSVVFHVAFFGIVTLIGLNIVLGIILDTFSELRSNKLIAEADMRSCCFICGRNSYEFETHAKGFRYHFTKEHNMWDYIFLLIHLDETRFTDLTTLELHVYNLRRDGVYDFFPIGRAMALSTKDKDVVLEMLEDLKSKVNFIEEKMLRDDEERQLEREREQQRRWERMHRSDSLAPPAT